MIRAKLITRDTIRDEIDRIRTLFEDGKAQYPGHKSKLRARYAKLTSILNKMNGWFYDDIPF